MAVFSFNTLNISCHSFLACRIAAKRIWLKTILGLSWMWYGSFSCCVQCSFFVWFFDNWNMIYLGKILFGLNLIDDIQASWTWIFLCFTIFGKFPAIIFLNMLSGSCSLLLPSETPTMQKSIHLMVSHNSYRSFTFFIIFSFLFSDLII